MTESVQTVIGIPGCWPDRRDIVTAIVKRSGGYIFAGLIMMKMGEKDGFTLEVCERDPQVSEAFSIAGRGRLTNEDLQAIDAHTFMLYLSAAGGTMDVAKKLLHAANALLKSGGLAVKIESAGTVHRAAEWAEFCDHDDHPGSLLKAYVTYIGSPGLYYSCGMHNLGYPDALIEADIPPNDAAKLLHTFLGYLLCENPALKDRETFSIDPAAPRYRLFREECTMYQADDLFHNPLGVWKLVPA